MSMHSTLRYLHAQAKSLKRIFVYYNTMKILPKIRDVLIAPQKFFQRIQKEKGFKKAFVYFAILSLFAIVLGYIFGLLMVPIYQQILASFSLDFPMMQYTSGWVVLNTILGYLIGLLASFIVAGLLHAWILIFGGKAEYDKTYQLYVYSRTPQFLFGWIPVLGFIAYIYGLVILIMGTMKMHKISKTKSILMYVIPIGLFFLFLVAFWGFAVYVVATRPEILQEILVK